MSMERIKLLLKQKYSLVHVPPERKVLKWRESVEQLLKDGQTMEQAGMTAAKKVFPYEYREYRVHEGKKVDAILSLF